MANTFINQINFHASKEAIDWLEEKMSELDILDYEEKPKKLIELFGVQDADNTVDKIGSKWLALDTGDRYREDEETYFLQCESANYPPNELIKNIVQMLTEKSDEDYWCYAEGRYWDNDNIGSTIGIFECNQDGYFNEETSVDVDFEDDCYWDNQIEPIFDELEL